MTSLTTSLTTAISNYTLLKKLPPNTKIYVNIYTNEMSLDNRWFSGLKRYSEGSSRIDIIQPLEDTFNVMQSTNIDETELLSTFNEFKA